MSACVQASSHHKWFVNGVLTLSLSISLFKATLCTSDIIWIITCWFCSCCFLIGSTYVRLWANICTKISQKLQHRANRSIFRLPFLFALIFRLLWKVARTLNFIYRIIIIIIIISIMSRSALRSVLQEQRNEIISVHQLRMCLVAKISKIK